VKFMGRAYNEINGYRVINCLFCGELNWFKGHGNPVICVDCVNRYKHKGVKIKNIEAWRKNLSDANKKEIQYIVDESGCYNCISHIGNNGGYPTLCVMGKQMLLHRYVYEQEHDLILMPQQIIMHLCDNPRCINPKHLKMGTVLENNKDMYSKKRHSWGERCNFAKLTEFEVKEIRTSDLPRKFLASKYSISISTISDIQNKRSWKSLEEDILAK